MWVLGIGTVKLGSGFEFSALRKMNIFHPYWVVILGLDGSELGYDFRVLGVCPAVFNISVFCLYR